MPVSAGSRVEYYNGAAWVEDSYFLKIKITDNIVGRVRLCELIIGNVTNLSETNYPPYRKVRITERASNTIIFIGRVEVTSSEFDENFGGQVLRVICRDFLHDIIDRKINGSYGPLSRSDIINGIVDDYRYETAPGVSPTIINIVNEVSGSSDSITRDYSSSYRPIGTVIEELAQEDPWTNTTWDAVYRWSGGWADYTVNANTGVAFVPLAAASHEFYLGQNNPFLGASFTITAPGTYGTMTWAYWDGSAWTPVNLIDSYAFAATGQVKWQLPTNWATVAVNGTTKYWIKCTTTSVTIAAIVTFVVCIRGFGYDYYVDDTQTFRYFRRASLPVGGASAAGLTVALGETESDTVRAMLYNYSFTDQPREIITKVTVRGVADDGTFVEQYAEDDNLISTYNIHKEKIDYVWGKNMSSATLTIYALARAQALLATNQEIITRGNFTITGYPYRNPGYSLVRVGQLIHIHISHLSINKDFVVLKVEYEEPSAITKIEVVTPTFGRSYSPLDTTSIIDNLRSGKDMNLSFATIGDLWVSSAFIANLTITKLTTGTLSAGQDMSVTTSGKIKTGNIGTNRIELNKDYIAGYDATDTKQFYIQSSDGRACAAAGAVILDSSGITIKNNGATTYFHFFYDNVAPTPDCDAYQYIDSAGALHIYAPNGDIELQSTASNSVFVNSANIGLKFAAAKYMGVIGTNDLIFNTNDTFGGGGTSRNSKFVPGTDLYGYLGNTNKRWNSLYVQSAYMTNLGDSSNILSILYTSNINDSTHYGISIYFTNGYITNLGSTSFPVTQAYMTTLGSAFNYVTNGYFGTVNTLNLEFGSYTAVGAETFQGYITAKDAAGNTRKIMVCA